jgi:phosphoribosylglycinamide formyltransferase-1
MPLKKIAVLASGNGSNTEKIITHFNNSDKAEVALIASNRREAYVLERAKKHWIPSLWFSKADMEEGRLCQILMEMEIHLVVLAGFLQKIPDNLIESFPDRIINIHPALLPKYGGKGMYGLFVHQAVKLQGEKETGITIHYVNKDYDEGKLIFQKSIEILPEDSPEDIAEKVHHLEHKYFPKVIESLL